MQYQQRKVKMSCPFECRILNGGTQSFSSTRLMMTKVFQTKKTYSNYQRLKQKLKNYLIGLYFVKPKAQMTYLVMTHPFFLHSHTSNNMPEKIGLKSLKKILIKHGNIIEKINSTGNKPSFYIIRSLKLTKQEKLVMLVI